MVIIAMNSHSPLESTNTASGSQTWEKNFALCRGVYNAYVKKIQEHPPKALPSPVQPAKFTSTTKRTSSGGSSGGKSREDVWEKHIRDLREFKGKNGHCRVPRHYNENPKLGRWVMNVRSHYQLVQKGKRSSLINQERLQQLENLDFDFAPKKKSHTQYYVDRWAQHMEELREFKEQNGHCRVPQRFADNKKLGGWVLYVRHQYRKFQLGQPSTMTRERVAQLEELGFDFAPRKGRPSPSENN